RAALVRERAADRVPDPPRGVGREAIAARVIEALDGLHEADVAFLDQVDERKATAVVAPRDRNDEAEVRLHELVLDVFAPARSLRDRVEVLLERRRARDGLLLLLRLRR